MCLEISLVHPKRWSDQILGNVHLFIVCDGKPPALSSVTERWLNSDWAVITVRHYLAVKFIELGPRLIKQASIVGIHFLIKSCQIISCAAKLTTLIPMHRSG